MKRFWALTTLVCGGCGEIVVPEGGPWRFDVVEVVEDGCNAAFSTATEALEVTRIGPAEIRATPSPGGDSYRCTVTGADFTCDERVAQRHADASVTATLSVTAILSGTFSSDAEATGEEVLTADCMGSDCVLTESLLQIAFPCTTTVRFAAAAGSV